MSNEKKSKGFFKRPKRIWNLQRSILFIIIGLFNTVFIKPEDLYSWKNYLGYILLIVGIIDIIVLIRGYIINKYKKEEGI